jgi:hypothetical protein
MIPPDEPQLQSTTASIEQPVEGGVPSREASVPPPPPPRRRGLWIGVAAASALVVVAVAAVAVFGGPDQSQPPPTAAPSAPPSPVPTIPAPRGLHASATAVPLVVTVSWISPGDSALGYRVYRDGEQVGTVPAPRTSFTDTDVRPNHTYTYEVLTRGEGVLQSERVSVAVDVPLPPLSAARVEGVFDVKVHPTSQKGFTQTFKDYTTGWSFDPRCNTGPCRVVWTWTIYQGIQDTLHRKGAKYDGSDTGKLNVKCSDTVVRSTVEIEFRVVKAKAVAGTWTATRLTGTMKQTSDAQLGCVASSLIAKVTASLLS